MGKFISFGDYNKLYKYIWIYLIIRFIPLFVIEKKLIFVQFQSEVLEIPARPFISLQIYYVGFLIISFILKAIKKFRGKKQDVKVIFQEKLIYNKLDISTEFSIGKRDYYFFINLFLVVSMEIFMEVVYSFKCQILNYWMFEMLFLEFFNSKFLNTKIYKHHIFSLIFILSSFSLINIIIIVLNFSYNTKEVESFNVIPNLVSI